MNKQKISLQQLALNITAKNIEKQKANESKNVVKAVKRKKSKNKSGFNIIKRNDGSLICFIPESMKTKGFNRKIENNLDLISEFKNSDETILKI